MSKISIASPPAPGYVGKITFEYNDPVGHISVNGLAFHFEYNAKTFEIKLGPGSADAKAAGVKIRKSSNVGFRDAMANALKGAIVAAQNLERNS